MGIGKRTIRLFLIITGCVVSCTAKAQSDLPKFEIGLQGGLSTYQGDLTPSLLGSYKTIDLTAGAHAGITITGAISFRVNYASGKLQGDDAAYNDRVWRRQRNFKFNCTYNEISVMGVWYIINRYQTTPGGFSPYVFAGLGYTALKIKRDYSRFNRQFFLGEPHVIAGLDADIAHTVPSGIPVLPIGVGIRYSISQNISINAETSLRISKTDYLDGFSKAAEPRQNDRYYLNTIGLIVSFQKKSKGASIDCPDIKL